MSYKIYLIGGNHIEKHYQTDTDMYFSERHSAILVKFRNENDRNTKFLLNLKTKKRIIQSLVENNVWQKINNLIKSITLHSNIESKYLNGQSIKDCISLSHFLDTDFVNTDFEEIIFNSNETKGVVYYDDGQRNNEN